MDISKLFDKPKIIGVIANPNEGKSNLLYYFISRVIGKASIHAFGLRCSIKGVASFNTIKELEEIKNSIVFIDEFNSLFDLENRKQSGDIEEVLRLVYHNNNIIILAGTGENFKKFISAKINVFIYKKVYYDELINGSKAKKIVQDYKDILNIKGTTQLNLSIEQLMIYDGAYNIYSIPYMKEYDTKKNNVQILRK